MPAAPPAPAPRPALTRQRCWNHPAREAAARCPSCARFYCRECVTEHAGRMVCAACLRAEFATGGRPPADDASKGGARRVLRAMARGAWQAAQVAAGIVVAWGFFHLAARKLASLPDSFHEGTVWKETFLGEPDE